MVKKLPIITNIELKNNVIPYEGLENKLLDMVRAYELSDRIIFSSFNHVSIKKMKKLAPDIPCGFICAGKVDANALAASARESGVEFIHPGLGILDDDFIDTMGRFNIPISVWTVNDEVDMKRLIKAGVYGVFTDDPELMARALQC